MALEQDYTFYFAQLEYLKNMADPECEDPGRPPEVTPGKPQAGYYRTRSDQAVVIWHSEGDTKIFAQTTTRNSSYPYLLRDPGRIDELFSEVCRLAVTDDAYNNFITTRTWPEDVEKPAEPAERGIGDNSKALALHERMRLGFDDMLAKARAWYAGIGSISKKSEADKSANYADHFAKTEKEARAALKDAVKGLDEERRRLKSLWDPIIEDAAAAKTEFKRTLDSYLAEAKKKAQEEEARARAESVEKDELFQGRPASAVVGTAGARVALRTYKECVITDWRALAQHYLTMDELPPEVKDGLYAVAKRQVLAGIIIPGASLKTEQRAA